MEINFGATMLCEQARATHAMESDDGGLGLDGPQSAVRLIVVRTPTHSVTTVEVSQQPRKAASYHQVPLRRGYLGKLTPLIVSSQFDVYRFRPDLSYLPRPPQNEDRVGRLLSPAAPNLPQNGVY